MPSKGTLTLKTLRGLHKKLKRMEADDLAGYILVKSDGVLINFKFPFIHRIIESKMVEKKRA